MENKIYPGLLHILQKYLSGCRLILWKLSENEDVGQMLKRNFHDVEIIYGSVDENDGVEAEDVIKAFDESDIMVHGSGHDIINKAFKKIHSTYAEGCAFIADLCHECT
ncbi:MAG: hypothetical protein AMS23_10510 [Bacteroides sp. SM1_62]|nr:MAG: hypothetical protein AMS26_09090 [Bacteroides sp. SM23_62]KPL20699.1 MAG: hypothetical protein AMS23_10510 [Bacteroides sp. SM1_62]